MEIFFEQDFLKCGFRKKSNYYGCNSSQLSISVITLGWVQQQTHPKVMTDMLKQGQATFFKMFK
jgi:hypothetical protein